MQYLVEIISEEEFKGIAEQAAAKMLSVAENVDEQKNIKMKKRHYVALVKESVELEDFLDDHGARSNTTWVFFREIVASIRNFSSTAYIVSHILTRINFYNLNNKRNDTFVKDSEKFISFLNDSIFRLFSNLKSEALKLQLVLPKTNFNYGSFEDSLVIKTLPQNLNSNVCTDINESVSRVATEFINAHNESESILFEKKLTPKELNSNLIPERINEETLRRLEAHVHNAQSMYDTYIQKTPKEMQEAMLSSLRGHISITLHLLGIAKELSHFVERHETNVRSEDAQDKITKIIKTKKVINTIINYALFYYTIYLKDGQALAHELLSMFTVSETARIKVPEGLGFHLRPSTLVAKVANHYGSNVTMIINDKEFDASSVIDTMWAGGMIKKENISEVTFSGDKNAIRDLKLLAEANYGEDTVGNSTPLPDELSYLRRD